MSSDDIATTVQRLLEAEPEELLAAYLFGSVARGTSRASSDVDLGVLYETAPSATLDSPPRRLEDRLERALGKAVQVIALNSAPPDLVHRVLRDGILLLERGRSARIRFEVKARNEYFDLLPTFTRYRSAASVVTEPELIEKNLARIETCLRELRTLARPEALANDVREQRFVEHTLQLAIQTALDAASHIVSDDRLGEPRTLRDLFDILERGGWIDPRLARPLRDMAGFRNVLVHGYDEVDHAIVRDILENRVGDLAEFATAIRARLRGSAR